jgi:hypothetical protein
MNEMSKKKICYPITDNVNYYLEKHGRKIVLPVTYESLLQYKESFPLGDTLWVSVMYDRNDFQQINEDLCCVYSVLKTEGDVSVIDHLRVDRIDFCLFGNSNPFRIRIINSFNDNYDYFYIKKTDISRIVGLEIEDILSPNRINYFVDNNTLVEEHISGIPGDDFIKNDLKHPKTNKTRLAKEFVKFNERCFYTLLGDMRSYNFVIEMTHDFDDIQYRIRSIDFDQQCYEGKKNNYLPQFYKENNKLVTLVTSKINPQTINQYRIEERSRIARRIRHSRYILKDLFDTIRKEELSTKEKVKQLKSELAVFYDDKRFLRCESMAEILKMQLFALLRTRTSF